MSSSIYNHRSLQPTGPPNPGPMQRLNDSFETIRQEFEGINQDNTLLRGQRDEFETKVTSQVNELNIIRQSLYDLESQHSKIRQQYEEEINRLRAELLAARQGLPPGAGVAAAANQAAHAGVTVGPGAPPPPPGAALATTSGPGYPDAYADRYRDRDRDRDRDRVDRMVVDRDPQREREILREREREREREQRDREREREREREQRERERERDQREAKRIKTDRIKSDRSDPFSPSLSGPSAPSSSAKLPPPPTPVVPASVQQQAAQSSASVMSNVPVPYGPPPPPSSEGAMVANGFQGGAGPATPVGVGEEIDIHSIPNDMKKEGPDWFAVFNPKVKRVLDVSLVHTLMHESVVCCVRFSADGKYLATGCNHTAQIYDAKTGVKTCVLLDETADKTRDLYIRSVCFSPDGKYLATGAEDKQIRIWDIAKRKIRTVFEGHQQEIYSLAFSRDGRLIVSGSGDRTARIWDMSDGSSKVLSINDGADEAGANGPNGPSTNGTVGTPGATPGSANGPPTPGGPNSSAAAAAAASGSSSDAGVTSVAISPSGNLVAAGSLDAIVRIWDVQTGQLVEKLKGHLDSVYSVAFTPDGRGLVSGSLDKTLRYWDVRGVGLSNGVAAGPGALVRNGSGVLGGKAKEDKNLCMMSFTGHKDYVLSVAVSHDANWVVSGSKDRGVQFWDSRTAVWQCMLQGHKNSVISIDLSPVNSLLATGSGDWQARIWSYSAN